MNFTAADASEEGVGDTRRKKFHNDLSAKLVRVPNGVLRTLFIRWNLQPPSVTTAYLLVCIHGSHLTFTAFTVTVGPVPPPASPDKRRFSLLLLPCKQWR